MKKQVKRLLILSSAAMALVAFVLLMRAARANGADRMVSGLQVEVEQEAGVWFVQESDVYRILGEMDEDSFRTSSVANVDLAAIERGLEMHPQVRNAEVWIGAGGQLQIAVSQRVPMLRVMHSQGVSYYLDTYGNPMPLSTTFTARVPLVSGVLGKAPDLSKRIVHGDEQLSMETDRRIGFSAEAQTAQSSLSPATSRGEEQQQTERHLRSEEDVRNVYWAGEVPAAINEITELVQYTSQHPFWSAMIEQIHRTEEGEYQLVPKVGDHLVSLGDMEGYRNKLNKLFVFYRDGLSHDGWSSISQIDLQYDGLAVVKKTVH